MADFKFNESGMRKLEQEVKRKTEDALSASLATHQDEPEGEAARLVRADMGQVGWHMSEAEALAVVRKVRSE